MQQPLGFGGAPLGNLFAAARQRSGAASLRMNATAMSALRVDAHHHVWRLDRGDYGWLTPALAPIYRDFTLDDLRPLLARVK